ncbi:transmembrane protein 243 isoform X1 [Ahaetulla prasina]|uniref:transmembrane protein 243 isoform X1 n=1 Tax=Ahaetulla prasina TaxID=499056 RepID=UPI00264903C4|nr:transmembrane protein 243 isoform X1 [Ahaetulla prasina]
MANVMHGCHRAISAGTQAIALDRLHCTCVGASRPPADFRVSAAHAGDTHARPCCPAPLGSLPSQESFGCQDRIINFAVGIVVSLLLIVTLISAFVFPHLPPKPVNIFFAFCISLSCVSAGILIYWYRQGDLEPKFRNLIYYILFSIIMLCICANLYFHEVGK